MVVDHIGPYRLVRRIGQGGMGAVFEAVHDAIERRVAIKILHPDHARSSTMVERFFNEARAANRVDHPGMVQISECGRLPNGAAYIVMEHLKGETLGRRLRRLRGRIPPVEIVRLCRQLAETLDAAHQKGIIHRDLKPDNVMLVPDPAVPGGERTKLLDFGIAKLRESAQNTTRAKTRTDLLMGTPGYMSPEQCRGAGLVDEKTDSYSLGVMLFRLFTGQMPFVGPGSGEVLAKHIYEPPPRVAELASWVPAPAAELVHRLLEKESTKRPGMKEVMGELDKLAPLMVGLEPPPIVEEEPVLDPSGGSEISELDSDSLMNTVDADRLYGSDRSLQVSFGPEGVIEETRRQRRRTLKLLVVCAACGALAGIVGAGTYALNHRSAQKPHPAPSPGVKVSAALIPADQLSKKLISGAQDQEDPSAPQKVSAAAAPDAAQSAAPIHPTPAPTPAKPVPAAPPAAATVRLFLDTVPQGAEVVRLADGTVLGKTPWQREQPAAEGTEEILLRFPGYAEQRLSVALAENTEHRVTLPRKRPIPVRALRPKDRQSDPIPIMD